MRVAKRLWASFLGFCLILYLVSIFDSQYRKSINLDNDTVLQNSKFSSIRTILHIDEYCVGYNFLQATESFREDNLEPITLAIHATSDMMSTLEKKPKNWDGPISLGIFVDYHSRDALEYLANVHRCDVEFQRKVTVHFAFRLSAFQNQCPTILLPISNQTCQSFLKNKKTLQKQITGPFQLYPSNVMRNIARKGAKSDIHFIADADMMMSEGFAKNVKLIANDMIDGKSKKLLVVRRFETNQTDIPKNYIELKDAVEKKKVFQFHHKFFFEGHKIANLSYWFNTTAKLQEVSSWEIPYPSVFWEVQVILHRNDLYNADYFPARIKVMQSLIYSLCRADYTFHLLSHVFNVHDGIKTTDTTYSKAVIQHGKAYGRKRALARFNREMNTTYPNSYAKCGKFIM